MTPVSITDRTGIPLGAASAAVPQHPLTAANQLLAGETVHQFIAESGAATLLAASAVAGARGPSTGPTPESLGARIDAVDLSAPLGGTNAALSEAADLYLKDAVYFHHPRYQAHLNCPVLIPAVAAEALVTSVNSSMDTWDQSAGATLIERRLTRWTADLIGLGADADGIFTSGGTQSNLQAMLIARNHAVASRTGSLPERLAGLRIYTSADSHFSISKASTLLGMGEDAVVSVPTDSAHRMDAAALRAAVEADAAAGLRPMAIVATAGTTDFGAIDPLAACATLAAEHGAWFHVDAAYGCGLLISRHRSRLAGIEAADSVTVDYHKSFFQPIGSSALLIADGANFGHITHYAEYLNPADQAGTVPNQVDKSLQTTRRFDALKLWVSLRSMGAEAIGALFDELIDLAATAASLVAAHPELELAAEAQLSTVVFRFVPSGHDGAATGAAAALNALQDEIRASLYSSGEAMVAATTVDGARHLKLTLLNPRATLADLEAVLTAVVVAGTRLTEEAAR
ncbi:pyridoxal-dependent decarboxylase [Kocuria polaris]|nr:pyridoxal-dependent decarboxylase [Kocuria polaris]